MEQESTLLHPNKSKRLAGFGFFRIKAPAIIENLKNDSIAFLFQPRLDPRSLSVARHIGQGFLKDAEDNSGRIRIECEQFLRQRHGAANPGSALELLSLRFKRSGKPRSSNVLGRSSEAILRSVAIVLSTN